MIRKFWKIFLVCLVAFGGSTSVSAQGGFGPPGLGNLLPQGQTAPPHSQPVPRQEHLKAALGVLVIDNVVSRDQAVRVLKYFDKHDAAVSVKKVLALSVSDNVITREQALKIEKALEKIQFQGPPGMDSGSKAKSTAVYTQNGKTAVKAGQTIIAAKNNQSAVKVSNGGSLTLSNSAINTSGSSSSDDDSNFYGLNAAVLAESFSKIKIADSTIRTSGNGANAVFATGFGSVIDVNNVKIETTNDSSRGLDATLKGTVSAVNVEISTAGMHSAAIATDRGNGTITVTGGTMYTTGIDSPGIYSTGDITVTNATLTATGSEAAVVEGKNSITLKNATLSSVKKRGVMMYQSFSGDAEVGTARFTMEGGSLTAHDGPLFYITNTEAAISLTGTDLTSPSGILLEAGAGNWGTAGKNGADVTFRVNKQTLQGNIVCDPISTVNMYLNNHSTLTGAVNQNNTARKVAMNLDNSSHWQVTGISYITSLRNDDQTLSNITDNGFTIYYDAADSGNDWLADQTLILQNGGKLTPKN